MKKSNNNNWKQFLRTAAFVALVMFITAMKLSATENKGDSLKAGKEVSKEEVVMIEDLLNSLEEVDELIDMTEVEVPAVEVYNGQDELLFSGTQAEWDAANLISMKRKAELLFQLDGTSIYKVF